MKKLHKLREWLDTHEASNYLSSALQEPVTRADVLRLAMDDYLRISVNLVNHARANISKPIHINEAKLFIFPNAEESPSLLNYDWLQYFTSPPPRDSRQAQEEWLGKNKANRDRLNVHVLGDVISEDTVVQFDDKEVVSIGGVWDLSMKGAERLDIEHAYYADSFIEYSLLSLENVVISSEDGTTYARVLERFSDDVKEHPLDDPRSYYPAGGLPRDSLLVVRLTELGKFLTSLDRGTERTLDKRERTTLLAIIGALADAQEIDLTKPIKAGDAISAMLELKGVQVSGRTIGEHLKAVRAALDSRKA